MTRRRDQKGGKGLERVPCRPGDLQPQEGRAFKLGQGDAPDTTIGAEQAHGRCRRDIHTGTTGPGCETTQSTSVSQASCAYQAHAHRKGQGQRPAALLNLTAGQATADCTQRRARSQRRDQAGNIQPPPSPSDIRLNTLPACVLACCVSLLLPASLGLGELSRSAGDAPSPASGRSSLEQETT